MPNKNKKPVIVGFVSDLMFNVRIGKVAEKLGYRVEWIESAEDVAPGDADTPHEEPGELLYGQGGALFQKLAALQPALLIFDLSNQLVPWREWIASLKSSSATRRLPILCFGSHVEVETLQTARKVGADEVVARSRFTSAMHELIEKHARKPDLEALEETCAKPLDPRAREGIDRFNNGEYYKCHDYLEEAWVEDESVGRDLYRGILQVGIAYFQIERGNYRGAAKMLLRVQQWLEPLPAICRCVDVARLREDVQNVQEALLELGPERLEELDRTLFRQIRLVEATSNGSF